MTDTEPQMLTAAQFAEIRGVDPSRARHIIHHAGIAAVGRQPGRSGANLYPAEQLHAIPAAEQGRRNDLFTRDAAPDVSPEPHPELLEFAADLARRSRESNGPDVRITTMFDDTITDYLHGRYPFLAALHTRVEASYRVDAEGKPRDDLRWAFDGSTPASAETRLAIDAYEAVMRAVLFGHRLGRDRSG